MKRKLSIGIAALICMIANSTIVMAEAPKQKMSFTKEMVSGKTMVSSGYNKGSVTFNPDGTLTCSGYPPVVACKTWQLDADGTIVRLFDDNSGTKPVGVRAVWRLVKNNGSSFTVDQTSSNSKVTSSITVSYK
jgi:hypothetical protein